MSRFASTQHIDLPTAQQEENKTLQSITPSTMQSQQQQISKTDSLLVPVGTGGFYSEFLVPTPNGSKAYIKTSFASNKMYYSEIDKAQQQRFRLVEQQRQVQDETHLYTQSNSTVGTPIYKEQHATVEHLTKSGPPSNGRRRITIAELLNPEIL